MAFTNKTVSPSLSHQQSCFSSIKTMFWRKTTHLPRPLVFHDHPLPWRWYDKLHILRANNAWRCFTTTQTKKQRKAVIVYVFSGNLSIVDFPKYKKFRTFSGNCYMI